MEVGAEADRGDTDTEEPSGDTRGLGRTLAWRGKQQMIATGCYDFIKGRTTDSTAFDALVAKMANVPRVPKEPTYWASFFMENHNRASVAFLRYVLSPACAVPGKSFIFQLYVNYDNGRRHAARDYVRDTFPVWVAAMDACDRRVELDAMDAQLADLRLWREDFGDDDDNKEAREASLDKWEAMLEGARKQHLLAERMRHQLTERMQHLAV